MIASKKQPIARKPIPGPLSSGDPPVPLTRRAWLLVLAVVLEAAWLAALVILALR